MKKPPGNGYNLCRDSAFSGGASKLHPFLGVIFRTNSLDHFEIAALISIAKPEYLIHFAVILILRISESGKVNASGMSFAHRSYLLWI